MKYLLMPFIFIGNLIIYLALLAKGNQQAWHMVFHKESENINFLSVQQDEVWPKDLWVALHKVTCPRCEYFKLRKTRILKKTPERKDGKTFGEAVKFAKEQK